MVEPGPPAPDEPRGVLEAEGLRRLLDVSRRINAEVVPDAVLAAIVDSLVGLTRADRGFLMLRGPDGELEFTIARDRDGRALEEQRFRVSRGVVDEVAATGRTRLIDDAANADAWQARASVIRLSLRTILCVPLKTPSAVVGVIYVDSNAITRRFTPDDVPLVEAFAAQAAAAVERVRLQRAELERDRMLGQLQIASEIQRTFLPATFPPIEGVVGAVSSLPAQQVGGDFYDVIRLPGGRAGILVADVAGKGVPGALFGARLLSDVRYEAIVQESAAHALAAVNRIVYDRATRGMFVTLFYAVVDPRTGRVEYANAGHPPPVLRTRTGVVDRWETPSGLPLGVTPDAVYAAGRAHLAAGETLLVLSDGIYDAEGPGGERFGTARVDAVVQRGPADPAGLLDALQKATATFTGRRPQADDQTLLALALA